MSPPGRPKGECRSAQPDAGAVAIPALAQQRCTTTSRWLAACGSSAGALGLLATALAAWGLSQSPALPGAAVWPLWAVLLLALPERVLALRLRFDAGLFADLAQQPNWPPERHTGQGDAPVQGPLAALDAALAELGLRAAPTPPSPPRPLADRIAGARRLGLQHLAVVGLQAAAIAAQLLALPWAAARPLAA